MEEPIGRGHHEAATRGTLSRGTAQGDRAACRRRRCLVVVVALVRGDHGGWVVGHALNGFAHRAAGRRALVVPPVVTSNKRTLIS